MARARASLLRPSSPARCRSFSIDGDRAAPVFLQQSPFGACPTCDGLGQVTLHFDPNQVVPDLSNAQHRASGAVKAPWSSSQPALTPITSRRCASVCAPFQGFDPTMRRWKKLPPKVKDAAGAAERHRRRTEVEFIYQFDDAKCKQRVVKRWQTFRRRSSTTCERRWRETESRVDRARGTGEIPDFAQPCTVCHGNATANPRRATCSWSKMRGTRRRHIAASRSSGLEHFTLRDCRRVVSRGWTKPSRATNTARSGGDKVLREIDARG